MNPVLLLVDDDEAIRTQMKWALSADYEIVSAEDRTGAVENFKKKKPAVTLLDLGLPPRPADPDEGLATLAELKAVDEMAKVIVISGQGEKKNALESELFGHEKGSFTGATTQRVGLVETANGGTLFLDEIGELPPSIQVKLLRFLQEHSFQRVGGRLELTSDARVVAATNVDLKAGINQGSFRADRYFSLAVLVISLPPLRARGGDA